MVRAAAMEAGNDERRIHDVPRGGYPCQVRGGVRRRLRYPWKGAPARKTAHVLTIGLEAEASISRGVGPLLIEEMTGRRASSI